MEVRWEEGVGCGVIFCSGGQKLGGGGGGSQAVLIEMGVERGGCGLRTRVELKAVTPKFFHPSCTMFSVTLRNTAV